MENLKQIEKEFQSWSGYPLEGETIEEKLECLRQVHWNLECELDQQKNGFERRLANLGNVDL